MGSRYEILFVDKTGQPNSYERISYIGGKDTDGAEWKFTQIEAIRRIEKREKEFYINKAGVSLDVFVAISRQGTKYIKTLKDAEQPESLLSLPESIK